MPDNSLLQSLLARATTPVTTLPSQISDAVYKPVTDWGMNHAGPVGAAARGFGAFGENVGTGLTELTSPLNLALTAGTGGLGRVGAALGIGGKVAPAAAEGLSSIVPELIQAGRGVKQVMPEADDVTRLASTLKQRLLHVPTGSKAATALGQSSAEFAPVGGESILNSARAGMGKVATPGARNVEQKLYQRIMDSGAGNMGSQTGEITPAGAAATAGLVGVGGYAGKQLYDMLQTAKNPLKHATGILDKAAGQ